MPHCFVLIFLPIWKANLIRNRKLGVLPSSWSSAFPVGGSVAPLWILSRHDCARFCPFCMKTPHQTFFFFSCPPLFFLAGTQANHPPPLSKPLPRRGRWKTVTPPITERETQSPDCSGISAQAFCIFIGMFLFAYKCQLWMLGFVAPKKDWNWEERMREEGDRRDSGRRVEKREGWWWWVWIAAAKWKCREKSGCEGGLLLGEALAAMFGARGRARPAAQAPPLLFPQQNATPAAWSWAALTLREREKHNPGDTDCRETFGKD